MAQLHTTTDFLYLYGLIPAEELKESEVPAMKGVDQRMVSIKIFKDIAAVISLVNSEDYSQQQIDNRLNDSKWLEEKAFQHHACIEKVHKSFTILPMSFCTIFQSENNLENLLHEKYSVILKMLTGLRDKQEWNLKIFCSMEQAKAFVENNLSSVTELKEALEKMPKGKQFLMKKRLEHLVTAEVEKIQSHWWHEIKQQLESVASDLVLRKNWGREVTGRNDDMIANCDVLIEKNKYQEFIHSVQTI